MSVQAELHVDVRGAVKRFGGTYALRGVDVRVRRGTVHGLVGENGAGKSTLGRLIGGALVPDGGEILVNGRSVRYRSPRAALRHGIALIAQEIALAPGLTVLENVFLGVEPTTSGFLRRRGPRAVFGELDARAGFGLDPDARVGELRLAEQQKVEILRALSRRASLIVMDEPTAALSTDARDGLLDVIRWLRDDGVSVVYVSHFLEDVLALADDVTVLKDGQVTLAAPANAHSPRELVAAMIGRDVELDRTVKTAAGWADAPRLHVRGLTRGRVFQDITFEVHAGEIVGIAGLVGSGRTEVARAIFGADRPDAGTIELDGGPVRIRHPSEAVRAGIAMLPESRKDQGLLMGRSIVENVSLPSRRRLARGPFIARGRERRRVAEICAAVDMRSPSLQAEVAALSGGNQQKALFAKWLLTAPRVLIADEPTRGVDVGAKLVIHELILQFAAQGGAAIVISSEFDEVVRLSHRVLVMRAGRIVGEFAGAEVTEPALVHAAFGTDVNAAGARQ